MTAIRRPAHLVAPVITAVVVALAAACGNATSGSSTQPSGGSSPTPTRSTPAPTPSGPSQSAADAARDGIVPALAALPLSVRMSVITSVTAPEGVWVISRPTASAKSYAKGCRLGPETGKYPTDTICTTEYGEVLLLDASRTHVLRAYPLAAVPPAFLAVTPAAVYFARTGDTVLSETTLPDSMVGRIDRATLKATVHVFAPGEESEVLQPCYFPPKYWSVIKGALTVKALEVDGRGVWVKGTSGWTRLDLVTLRVLERNVVR